MGESAISKVDLKMLWEVMQRGNKGCAFFTELCSDDPARQQVAVSRLCEVMQQVYVTLQKPTYKKYINKDLYEKATKELKDLEPHWAILVCKDAVGGEGNDPVTMTVGKLNYKMNATITEARDETKVTAAAKKVHEWLSKEKSDLRSLLSFLSTGGLFYVAQCHEKTHRAYLQSPATKRPISQDDFVDMNKKRLCNKAEAMAMPQSCTDLPA